MFINASKSTNNTNIQCVYSKIPRDQALISNKITRGKRFVLFPEFKSWLDDWRYLNHPKHFIYWISNFYPKKTDSKYIRSYIHDIINNINEVINYKISSITEGLSPDNANFHFNFFNYEICPTDDPLATIKDVQSIELMLIYPPHIIKENRYRAHGGITLDPKDNSSRSFMKFNIHHTFLVHQDFQYDPVIYTCDSNENKCIIDLYACMLHEALHGFGIEHTEQNLTTENFRAVMHLFTSRIMCHDDIRAIRKVYGLRVKREYVKYDDTCRRDFPLNKLQKIFKKIHQWIILYCSYIIPCISFITFLSTIIYIMLRRRYLNSRNDDDDTSSLQSDDSRQRYKRKDKTAMNAFLWHDEYMNN